MDTLDETMNVPINDENVPTTESKTKRASGALHKRIGRSAEFFKLLQKSEEVKQIASTLKYTDATIKEGVNLMKKAQEMMEAQWIAKGREQALTQTVQAMRNELNDEYMLHLKWVRLYFKTNPELLAELRVKGTRKRGFESWLFELQVFYHAVLQVPTVAKLFADNDVDEKVIKALLKKVEDLKALESDKKQLRLENKQMTQQRNEAIYQVEKWVSIFRQRARAQYFRNKDIRILLQV